MLIILVMALVINGCATDIRIKAASETIVVNEDLSGQVSQAIALTTYDFEQAGFYYSTTTPEVNIAQSLAEDFGWTNYDYRYWTEGTNEWVEITQPFATPDELYQFLGATFSDTSAGAGGSGSSATGLNVDDFPAFSLTREEKLFWIEYRLEGTLIALEATGATIEQATLYTRLPGTIRTSDTDGRVLEDGQTVAWEWGQFDYVPHHHVTTMPHWRNIILALGGLGILVGGMVVIAGVGGVAFWRTRQAKVVKEHMV